MAAPKKSIDELRVEKVTVYMPYDDYVAISKHAKDERLSRSAFMLRASVEKAKKINNKV